jgi:proteasome accessory factor B
VARKSERLMNLVIALLVTRHFVTKARLREIVDEYREASSLEAFEKMFERDKDELRELGIKIEVHTLDKGFDDEVGYRIRREEFEMPALEVTAAEAAILGLAARVWDSARMATATTSAITKLQVAGIAIDSGALDVLTPRLPTGERAFEPLLEAIKERQTVRFDYHRPGSPSATRTLQPWGVLFHGSRWYVLGHDIDRGQPRLFRLSRITTEVEKVGRPESYEVPLDVDLKAEARRLRPDEPTRSATVRVKAGAAFGLRNRATSVEPGPPGWDVLHVPLGAVDSLAEELRSYAAAVVVDEPPDLREAVVDGLMALSRREAS